MNILRYVEGSIWNIINKKEHRVKKPVIFTFCSLPLSFLVHTLFSGFDSETDRCRASAPHWRTPTLPFKSALLSSFKSATPSPHPRPAEPVTRPSFFNLPTGLYLQTQIYIHLTLHSHFISFSFAFAFHFISFHFISLSLS